MSIRTFTVGALAAVSISQAASASIVSFSNQVLWNNYVTVQGMVSAQESFNSFSGYYASLSGTTGGVSWTASSSGGLNASNGVLATNSASPESMTFSFGSGVRAIGGNFFATNGSFNVVASILQVTLSDGSGYIGYSTSASDFIGFVSSGASITSITIAASGTGAVYPSIDNLYVGVVPAPGAAALLGMAGLAGRGRRRR